MHSLPEPTTKWQATNTAWPRDVEQGERVLLQTAITTNILG